jgi:hypothetical protein
MAVEIPGAGFRIAGYIDRLDISGDGRHALQPEPTLHRVAVHLAVNGIKAHVLNHRCVDA